MSAQSQSRLTPEQYLEIERAAETRSEYYNGRMYAMSGGSPRHAFIIMNIGHRLSSALEEGPCRVAGGDLRVLAGSGGSLHVS